MVPAGPAPVTDTGHRTRAPRPTGRGGASGIRASRRAGRRRGGTRGSRSRRRGTRHRRSPDALSRRARIRRARSRHCRDRRSGTSTIRPRSTPKHPGGLVLDRRPAAGLSQRAELPTGPRPALCRVARGVGRTGRPARARRGIPGTGLTGDPAGHERPPDGRPNRRERSPLGMTAVTVEKAVAGRPAATGPGGDRPEPEPLGHGPAGRRGRRRPGGRVVAPGG